MDLDDSVPMWIGAGDVGRLLGLRTTHVYRLDPILQPQISLLPSGRQRRLYERARVQAYLDERARLAAARANLKSVNR
jgi:hypothetical protein